MKIPKTLGACADLLFDTRNQRLALQKEVEALQEQETKLKDHLIAQLPKSQAEGIAGKKARATIVTKQVPKVADWAKLHAYVRRTGEFELLARQVTPSAVAERWEAKQQIPGVEAFTVTTVSLNKTK